MNQALQQMGLAGYMPAPMIPFGAEVGRLGAPSLGHPAEAGARWESGYYDIGYYPQIGAVALPTPGGMQLMPAQALAPMSAGQVANAAAFASPQVSAWQPTQNRVLWLGFRFAGILSGANQAVSSSPQDTFAPRKVVIPGSVAPNFEIADLKIGAISQLSSSDPIPAEAFIPNAQLTDVHFDTAKISQQVTFSVNNISNATATFRASMNGFVVR